MARLGLHLKGRLNALQDLLLMKSFLLAGTPRAPESHTAVSGESLGVQAWIGQHYVCSIVMIQTQELQCLIFQLSV